MSFCRHKSLTICRSILRQLNNPQIAGTRNISRWVAPTLKVLHSRREKVGPEPLKPRSTFLEWNYEAEVFAFGKRLGEEFEPNVLKKALTHRSYVNLKSDEAKDKGDNVEEVASNEVLIEDGDKIINDYLREELGKTYDSDVVAAFVSYLTSEEMLAHVALHLGLKDIVLTGEFPVEKSTLAATFKAVVAALKSSQNHTRANVFVKDFLQSHLIEKELFDIWQPSDPYDYLKRKFQEEVEPRLCNQSASNTILANYQVGLYSDKKLLGLGWGESIETAKETAALDALQRLHVQK